MKKISFYFSKILEENMTQTEHYKYNLESIAVKHYLL